MKASIATLRKFLKACGIDTSNMKLYHNHHAWFHAKVGAQAATLEASLKASDFQLVKTNRGKYHRLASDQSDIAHNTPYVERVYTHPQILGAVGIFFYKNRPEASGAYMVSTVSVPAHLRKTYK